MYHGAMKEKNTLVIALACLVIGGVIGWALKPSAGAHMDQAMGSMTDALIGASSAEFDQAFLSQMILHHEGALEMAALGLERASHEEIRLMSQDIISTQSKEIDAMKEWQSSWRSER